MISIGSGPPIVLIPGIQGRYEWMLPAVRSLARHHRVLTFSLHEAGGTAFDDWIDYLDRELDRADAARVTMVGVSFGGVIAARYASKRPSRVANLILVSTPSPRWQPDPRTSAYIRRPIWSTPAFVVRAATRLVPEVTAALPGWPRRVAFLVQHLGRVVRFPASPKQMAERVRFWKSTDMAEDCARISAPTLVITGEPHLDRVVANASSLEYLSLIPHAKHVTLRNTGHIGLVTKPDVFAELIETFLDSCAPNPAAGERLSPRIACS